MKASTNITSLDELKARQALLNAEQSLLAKEIVSDGKTALVSLPAVTLFKPDDPLKIIKVDGEINIPAKVFSYLLPLLVNRILFRKSGFITRMVMTMIARRIGIKIGPKITKRLLNAIENDLLSRRLGEPHLAGKVLQHINTIQAERLK